MKFGFYTLGCKVNQYETQAMEQLFRARGHEIGQFDEVCDGYMINTYDVANVLDTYVYELGIQGFQYGLSTAIGLFNSVINIILL